MSPDEPGLRAPELRAAFSDPRSDLRWHGLGAVYRHDYGAVLVVWPDGRTRGTATYSDESGAGSPVSAPHELLALGLTAADCAAVASRGWRSDRRSQARAVAAERARRRAQLLRDLRRGEPPPGSYCLARRGGRPCPLIRFPDGAGWWGDDERPCRPWAWGQKPRGLPVARLLAVNLSADQCRSLSAITSPERAVEAARSLP